MSTTGNGAPRPEQVTATARAVAHGLQRYVFTLPVAVYPEGGSFPGGCGAGACVVPESLQRPESRERTGPLPPALDETGLQVGPPSGPRFSKDPGIPSSERPSSWDRLRAGRPNHPPEDGQRNMQWVSAADVARAAVLVRHPWESGVNRPFNLAGRPITHAVVRAAASPGGGGGAELVPFPERRSQAAGGTVFGPPLYFGVFLDIPPHHRSGEGVRAFLGMGAHAPRGGTPGDLRVCTAAGAARAGRGRSIGSWNQWGGAEAGETLPVVIGGEHPSHRTALAVARQRASIGRVPRGCTCQRRVPNHRRVACSRFVPRLN